MLIEYPEVANEIRVIDLPALHRSASRNTSVRVGFLGAGSFALSTLLPAIKRVGGTELILAASANGSHARHAAAKFAFRSCATSDEEIFSHAAVNTVVIATRHHLHAPQTIAALKSGKHVFCEKPLCLNEMELAGIAAAYDQCREQLLMVGFNRRFAPLAMRMKSFLSGVNEPLALHYRVNAGFLPADHWLNDPTQGGGRIIGEVCHFVDFLRYLAQSAPLEVETRALSNPGRYSNDNVICSLRFANGSHGTISYFANGDKSFSKERIEVFGGASVAVLEDFRRLELVRSGKKQVHRSRFRQDKGHAGEWQAFVNAIERGEPSPISFAEISTTMLTSFALEESRCLGRPVSIAPLQLTPGIHAANGFHRAF